MGRNTPKFYAVANGRQKGIFRTWEECKKQVHKYPQAKFKSFKLKKDAENYLKNNTLQKEPEKEPQEFSFPVKRQRQEPKEGCTGNKRNHKDKCHYLYFDGASKGNPGEAGSGWVILNKDTEVDQGSKYLGVQTNNFAEYTALMEGLQAATKLNVEVLHIRGDSLLVVNQINKKFKAKNQALKKILSQIRTLLAEIQQWDIKHVYREANSRADELANLGISKTHLIHNG